MSTASYQRAQDLATSPDGQTCAEPTDMPSTDILWKRQPCPELQVPKQAHQEIGTLT